LFSGITVNLVRADKLTWNTRPIIWAIPL
jgi:hypothetical protein